MPMLDKPLSELKDYRGCSQRPADFDEYWERALAELDGVDPAVEMTPSPDFSCASADCFDLRFTGVGGARVYAKYLRPKNVPAEPHPCVLWFHGYYGNGGEWFEKLAYVSLGFSVLVMDCRGQSGFSEDTLVTKGKTMGGMITRGLVDGADNLHYRNVFLDAKQLTRVAMDLPEVDAGRIGTFGGSQGGALSLVCASLEPKIKRCAAIHPFLSDYKRVWDMDLDKGPYEDLRKWFREYDPRHDREDEFFHTLGYIDIQNLTSRIKGEVLMATTLLDDICPPSTQFAAYNAIESKKSMDIYPDYGHELLRGNFDRMFMFLAGM